VGGLRWRARDAGGRIARFIRLPDFVAAIAELMAHQRNPRIVVCGGERIELAQASCAR